jgi:hypothetical protein
MSILVHAIHRLPFSYCTHPDTIPVPMTINASLPFKCYRHNWEVKNKEEKKSNCPRRTTCKKTSIQNGERGKMYADALEYEDLRRV